MTLQGWLAKKKNSKPGEALYGHFFCKRDLQDPERRFE